MIMAHDAATCSLNPVESEFVKTQNGNFASMLDCGARVIDYRPYLDGKKIYGHHGPIVIYTEMKDAINQMKNWAKSHTDDLVIISVSHCVDKRLDNHYYAQGCADAVKELLSSMSVPVIQESELGSMTKRTSIQRGNVVAIFNSIASNSWKENIVCYSKHYTCYDAWPGHKEIPWNNLKNNVNQYTAIPPSWDGRFAIVDFNWQSSGDSDFYALLHKGGSLLNTESRSGLNKWTATQIAANAFPHLNWINVDNVCDNGQAIYQAIQGFNLSPPKAYVQSIQGGNKNVTKHRW
jgi:hypothetical protein